MAEICPVCGEKIGFLDGDFPQDGIEVHTRCLGEFFQDPEKYGGTVKTEAQIKAEKEHKEHKEHQKKEPSDKDFVTTLLICIFLGGLGGHRFFVGKEETAIAMLVMPIVAALIFEFLAFGLGILLFAVWGVWYLFDLLQIVTSSFEDNEGRVIAYQAAVTANTAPSTHVPEKVVEAPPAKDIPAEIEKLADLKDKGIITDEEFQQKKQELLERI